MKLFLKVIRIVIIRRQLNFLLYRLDPIFGKSKSYIIFLTIYFFSNIFSSWLQKIDEKQIFPALNIIEIQSKEM